MPVTINLPAVLVANLMGAMLCFMMLTGRQWKLMGKDNERKAIRAMLISAMLSCAVDPLVFLFDGKPGLPAFLTVYAGNTWLFMCNIIIGPSWYILVLNHMEGSVSAARKRFILACWGAGLILLVINPFVPIVFRLDSANVYSRGPCYWLFLALDFVFVINGVVVYFRAKRKGGALQFFPLWQFVVPATIGAVVQSCFYGISTIWPCLAISINGLLYCLQSEVIYRDGLTGLFNRNYLDVLKKKLDKGRVRVIAAMMVDMNDFKSINDRFGHLTGDKAIKECGEILHAAVGSRGNVIRYAGDEFIVVMNTQNTDEVSAMARTIREGFERRNSENPDGYQLSAAIGCCLFDFSTQTADQLMNVIDSKMYEDKQEYYRQHPRQRV